MFHCFHVKTHKFFAKSIAELKQQIRLFLESAFCFPRLFGYTETSLVLNITLLLTVNSANVNIHLWANLGNLNKINLDKIILV